MSGPTPLIDYRIGMSMLQREVEERKSAYVECVIRRALLKRGSWDDPLYRDLAERLGKDSPAYSQQRDARKQHYEDSTVRRASVCDARGYRVPPATDRDLVDVGVRIARYEQAIADGMDLHTATSFYGDLAIRGIHEDREKSHGLARLEAVRRHPDRRRRVFEWHPQSEDPRVRDAHGYWMELIKISLEHFTLLKDTTDFHANDFLRIIYLYGDTPAHVRARRPPWRPHDALDRDPDFSGRAEEAMRRALLDFKYWMDEEPKAEHCTELRKARLSAPEPPADEAAAKYEMTFWSENHQILFPAAEYLAGQWMPDGVFMPGRPYRPNRDDLKRGDFTGVQRMARAKPRIMRWLDDRLRFGFSEWNAPGYYKEHLQALFNLADFALDPEIRTSTHMVLDLMFFDLARFSHGGMFGTTAGRAYFEHKNCGWDQGVADLAEMLFGTHRGVYVEVEPASGMFASSRVYRTPDAILAIGQDRDARLVDRSRVSLNFDEAGDYGIGVHGEDDILRWWSRSAYFCKQVIERTREVAEHHKLMYSPPFDQILPLTGLVDSTEAWVGAAIATVLHPPIGFPLLGLLHAVDEEEMADFASIMTEGSALTRANLYCYRDPHVCLSSVFNFHPGQYNFQSHVCQATLSMGATVWTSHPSAGATLDNLKAFFEAAGAVGGILGGGILGASLGWLASAGLGGFLAGGPAAGLAAGVKKGFDLGKAAGEGLGNVKMIPVTHDGPTWWTGSVTLPRVIQEGGAAIIAYKPQEFQLLLFGHRTHAWFPRGAFDPGADEDERRADTPADGQGEPIIPSLTPVPSRNANVDTGAWIFGKVGDGYVALYSGQQPKMTSSGDWADREIVAEGKRNIFILQVGSRDDFGSYAAFKRQVAGARIHINGLHWAPADLQCSYDVPNGKRLELHYDGNEVSVAGFALDDDHHPRFENPYAQASWQQRKYVIQHKGRSLTHDVQKRERRVGGPLSELAHEIGWRVHFQNTGLFPADLFGLPFTTIRLYKGTERERALQTLIGMLLAEQYDVVGLSEMWHKPDRARIRAAVGHIYPSSIEGPDESDLERFDGGLMLLSRHKIVTSSQTIFRQSLGEDAFANKGALHARIQAAGAPCAVDVFLSHTQGPAPEITGSRADTRAVIRQQLRHLGAFVRSCRDWRAPALLLGDLNVDGIHDPDQYAFLCGELAGGVDLHPTVRGESGRVHPDATSEDDAADGPRISSFNDGHAPRGPLDGARFGARAQRLDYVFGWDGVVCGASYPRADRQIVLRQSSPGRDMSDHYGIEVGLDTLVQRLAGPPRTIPRILIRLTRFWCLDTTSGPGDDEVRFKLRGVPARGAERAAESTLFEDVGPGTSRRIDSVGVELEDPGDFAIVAVEGVEADDITADDSLGTTHVRWTRAELLQAAGPAFRLVLPRLTGDGGEYAVEVELHIQ